LLLQDNKIKACMTKLNQHKYMKSAVYTQGGKHEKSFKSTVKWWQRKVYHGRLMVRTTPI